MPFPPHLLIKKIPNYENWSQNNPYEDAWKTQLSMSTLSSALLTIKGPIQHQNIGSNDLYCYHVHDKTSDSNYRAASSSALDSKSQMVCNIYVTVTGRINHLPIS